MHIKSLFIVLFLSPSWYFISAQTMLNECNSSSHKIVHPFLGEWEEFTVTDTAEIYIGRLSTKLNINNCVLTQEFMSVDSSFSYLSHGYVNPTSGIWEETYVFNSGGISKYLWIVEGNSLYTLRVDRNRKSQKLHRLKYINVKLDEYTVVQQESSDGGKTWESRDTTRIERIN